MPTIKLSQLQDDPRNANVCSQETLEKIGRNIERSGYYPSLIVRPHPQKEGHYIILDGHHRKQILEKLGYKEAECQVWEVDDQEAQLGLATLNRLRGEDEPRKRAQLLQTLTQTFSVPDLAQLVPESQGEIKDLLALLELNWEEAGERIRIQIEQEEQALPVPFGCMIASVDYPLVEQVFSTLEGSDQGQKLVTLCRYFLKNGGQNNDDNA